MERGFCLYKSRGRVMRGWFEYADAFGSSGGEKYVFFTGAEDCVHECCNRGGGKCARAFCGLL